jgi:hypothetical protein
MKNYRLLILAISYLFLACHNNDEKVNTQKQEEKKDFFPIADYIKSEINYVDSMPLGIIKYNIRNGKTDSVFIKTDEFDQLAQEFLPTELKDSIFEKNFTETSFLDQTTQLLTFTYSTKNSTIQLQRVDVLATPSNGFDKVKSVYMEKNFIRKDTSVTMKMYWRAKKSFQIISILQPTNQQPVTKQLKVVWDNFE